MSDYDLKRKVSKTTVGRSSGTSPVERSSGISPVERSSAERLVERSSAERLVERSSAAMAQRKNAGKLRPSLLPVECVEALLEVLEFGAKKYSPGNWKKGLTYSSILDSAERHIMARRKGSPTDDESGCWHSAHAAINLLFLTYFEITGRNELDDLTRETT